MSLQLSDHVSRIGQTKVKKKINWKPRTKADILELLVVNGKVMLNLIWKLRCVECGLGFFSAFHKRWGIFWQAKLLADCEPNPIKSTFLHLRRLRIGLNVIMVEKGGRVLCFHRARICSELIRKHHGWNLIVLREMYFQLSKNSSFK
jgi:hypothetical protein